MILSVQAKVAACPESFFYSLNSPAFAACQALADLKNGKDVPADCLIERDIKVLDAQAKPYSDNGFGNWCARKWHQLIRLFTRFFYALTKKEDPYLALYQAYQPNHLAQLPSELLTKILLLSGNIDAVRFGVFRKLLAPLDQGLFWNAVRKQLEYPVRPGETDEGAVRALCKRLRDLKGISYNVFESRLHGQPVLKELLDRQKQKTKEPASIQNLKELVQGNLALSVAISIDNLPVLRKQAADVEVLITRIEELSLANPPLVEHKLSLFNITPLCLEKFRLRALILNVSSSGLTEFPDFSSWGSGRLRILKVVENSIQRFPASIQGLEGLTHLSLWANQIDEFPIEFMRKLPALTSLDLHHNKLKALPESISELTNLRLLNLGFNQIKELPEEVGRLTVLIHLTLSHNYLMSLPDSIGHLQQLRELELSHNPLQMLPHSFARLRNLRKLMVGDDKRPLIMPDYLTTFTQLKTFFWVGKVCDGFGRGLRSLKSLSLVKGELTSAAFIAHNTGLEYLCLRENRLSELPEAVLPKLITLDIHKNPMQQVPSWAKGFI